MCDIVKGNEDGSSVPHVTLLCFLVGLRSVEQGAMQGRKEYCRGVSEQHCGIDMVGRVVG